MISASSDSLQRVIDRYRWMTRACTAIVLWLSVVNASSRAEQIVVVVLDDSGSMQKTASTGATRIDAAKASLGAVLEQLPHDTQFGILALNSRVKGSPWIVPLGSPDYQRWHDELSSVRAYGGTPLGQHMREAADELLKMRAKNPFAVYRLLVVTDGEATDAPILRAIMPDLLSRGLNLDVIGVGMSEDIRLPAWHIHIDAPAISKHSLKLYPKHLQRRLAITKPTSRNLICCLVYPMMWQPNWLTRYQQSTMDRWMFQSPQERMQPALASAMRINQMGRLVQALLLRNRRTMRRIKMETPLNLLEELYSVHYHRSAAAVHRS